MCKKIVVCVQEREAVWKKDAAANVFPERCTFFVSFEVKISSLSLFFR